MKRYLVKLKQLKINIRNTFRMMDEFIKRQFQRRGVACRSGVLANLITLDIFIIPSCIAGILYSNANDVKTFLFVVIGALLLFTLYNYGSLLRKNPRLLHSEEYLVEDKRLDIQAMSGQIPQLPPPNQVQETPDGRFLNE